MRNVLEQLHPATEVREALGGISRQTFWRLYRRGEIRIVRIGGRVYVEASEVRRFIEAQRDSVPNDEDPAATGSLVRASAGEVGRGNPG